MAESNATQVILTDDGLKIIKAQSTADTAASGVANLNDPNLMSVIEKQTQAAQYAGLTSQYNVTLARAKDTSISTTALTTAYTNLNTFMTAILTDTTKASDVNRDTYKSLTDAYNTALSNVQTALKDAYNTDIDNMQSSVAVASQAASSAVIVASQATVTGNSASQVASQAYSAATVAQSAGNNATSIANNASQAASNAVLAGSQAAVSANKAITAASQAQTAGNNATSIANSASQAASSAILAGSTATVSANKASADYQTLSAGVKDGSVVHITTETVIDKGVIGTAEIANGAITNAQIGNAAVNSAKIANLAVGTAQIANGAITNAQIGSEAVGTANIKDAAITSAQIADLAVGTAQIGDGAITNAKIGKLAVGTAQIANAAITDAQVGNVSANKLTAGIIDFNTITGKNINASNITTGKLSTDRLNVDKLSAVSANLGDVTTGSLKGVDIVANTFSTPNGSFTTDKNGAVVASNLTIRGVTNLVYNAALSGGNGSYIPGWSISNNGCYWPGNIHDGVPSIGWNNSTGAGVWTNFAQTKLYPLNGATGIPFSASVWFLDFGSDTSLQYQFTLAFFDSNGNRIDGYVGNTWNGIGSEQGWRYVTVENVTPPSNAIYVGLQYWSYNGHGNACFSSPMLTQTAQATGYQPDTGNVVSAGEIDGSVINGSTINGTIFHGGDIINNSNNTSNWHPFTADSNGVVSSYFSDNDFANLARLYSGNLVISNRNMNANSGSNNYGGSTAVIGGESISLSSGYTVGKDTNFDKSLVAEGEPGTTKLVLSGIDGITLKGDDQKIHFHGMYSDSQPKGITLTPYGNINGDEGSTMGTWYVGYNLANMTAQFGIDNLNQNTINLYRPTFVDEIGAVGNRLANGRLLLHAVDGNAQMYLLNDGSPAFVSPTIYNRTYSNGSNMFVTSSGRVGRSTSASKYKLAITRSDDTKQADRLMTLNAASWNDKVATEKMAKSLSNGEIPVEPEINLKRHYGLIAEDLRDAGLDEFLLYGKNGEIEGIEYDRLWTVLIPKIKQLNNRINELERKTL
ncbi:beta strand repeat-containing protein [Lactiplantibacillus plantarum]|uniref:beta strand repeat-containing protein n=1 Tax=Lactiplantibacillus plantarum TaxID=1590 RepID=UPI0009352790|nr:phage tail protein [Lactiplantibacillus plantarum]